MMRNDEFEDVIKMVKENYEEKRLYRLQKEESRRMKEAKKIRRRGVIIKTTIGIILVPFLVSYIANTRDKTVDIIPKDAIIRKSDREIGNIIPQTSKREILVSEQTEEQKLIRKYCDGIYNVDYDVAYSIASKLTNNFKSDEYLQTNNTKNKINKKIVNNKEQGIILFIRHLYQKPQDFGVTKDKIRNKNFVPNVKGNEESKVKYYSELFGLDPILTLAIEYHEASRYSSNAYLTHNNPAGLMIDGENLWHFDSPDAGIIEHIYQLKKNYIDMGYTTPKEIQKRYAPENVSNDPTNLNQFWVVSVEKIMKEIKNDSNIFNDTENKMKF